VEDFLSIPKYHAYVNLVADGHPSGWALVETLPAPLAISDPDMVRAAAHANHAPIPTAAVAPAAAEVDTESNTEAAVVVADQVGRKRRQR
jgi:hypothetical protein